MVSSYGIAKYLCVIGSSCQGLHSALLVAYIKRMNHFVPDFDLEDDYSIPTSSGLTRPKKTAMPEDDIMELLWQNGQVVMQSQAQRSSKKSAVPKFDDAVLPAGEQSSAREIRPSQDHHHQHQHQQQQHLFLQEDEMASWLHYPLHDNNFDNDFCADLLYPSSSAACLTSATTTNATPHPSASTSTTPAPCHSSHPIQNPETRAPVAAARPPIPPSRRAEVVQNFSHFSRQKARVSAAESIQANLRAGRETTVVDSSETPAAISDSRASEAAVSRSALGTSSADNACRTIGGAAVAVRSSDNNNSRSNNYMTTCEMTVTSSPGGSSASAEPILPKPTVDDRKRKGRDEEAECQSEDADFESAEAKKSARGSSSTKRSRAAEVHNLSERRRRDRINEKMKALQELIPRCNKSDKASMLDEAIEYLKSLQLQVQMMSMGCSMVPMMFPGVQQYMPPMGMGMGMGMGMNRPMMPFPGVLTGPSLPTPASAAAHLGPRFPMPPYQMPPVPSPPDSSRIQASSQTDPMLSSMVPNDPNQPRVSSFPDPYQQYLGLHQMQMPLPQNQAMLQPSSSRPSAGEGPDNIDNHQTGT